MKNFIIICKQKYSFLESVLKTFFNAYTPEEKTLAQIQAEAWVSVLQKNYSREQQNEILAMTGKLLLEKREEEISKAYKDISNLKTTNTELYNLDLSKIRFEF
jgi:hypothetical protein